MVATATPETQKKNEPNAQATEAPKMGELKDVCDAALQGFCEYAKSKPETIALWCLGIGFVLGWKLRP
jgi:hypothetical protein